MDEALRELERACTESPANAAAWTALARARQRAGARPAEVLAAVRDGLRADPTSEALAAVRDEALAAFFEAPSFETLFEQRGRSEGRLLFSPDGALVAAARTGSTVLLTATGKFVGAVSTTPGSLRAFVEGDLLVAGDGLRRVSTRDGAIVASQADTGRAIALAGSLDGSRAVLGTADGVITRFATERGALATTERIPLPALERACLVVTGRSPAEDTVFGFRRNTLFSHTGARFEEERRLGEMAEVRDAAASEGFVAANDAFGCTILPRAGTGHAIRLPVFFFAFAPDGRALAGAIANQPRVIRLPELTGEHVLLDLRTCHGITFSPCGSRIALDRRALGILVLEAT
jgi:hypothetical protein